MLMSLLKNWNRRLGFSEFESWDLLGALQRMFLARLLILFSVLLVLLVRDTLYGMEQGGAEVGWGYGLLVLGFGFTFIHSLFIEKVPRRFWVVGYQIVFDTFLISLWILLSSHGENLYVLLYLIQILVVALTFYQRQALFSALLACLFFGVVSYYQTGETLEMFLTWASYSALFLFLGFVGGYLNEELIQATTRLGEKEEKIKRLQDIQQEILTHMPTGLLMVNDQMQVTYLNPAAEHILNLPSDKLLGHNLSEIEPGLLQFFTQIPEEIITDPSETDPETQISSTGDALHRSYFVKPKSQSEKLRLQQSVEVGSHENARVIRGDVAEFLGMGDLFGSRTGRLLLFQDVTRIRHLEDKVRQHEKLAAVGQLAAGIAHEIRNPLASMSASIEMLKATLPPKAVQEEDRKLMDIAIREIDRLNRLITEFLEYVKPAKMKFSPVDLRELLTELLLSLKNTREFQGEIVINEKCQKTEVLGHAEKIKQVAWNLLVNAAQAMPKGGRIEVGCAPINEKLGKFWVTDTGIGMSADVLSHLFEPFFTTKDRGTGLGLATAYRIIEAHQGEMRVDSKPGEGTKFEVLLPLA